VEGAVPALLELDRAELALPVRADDVVALLLALAGLTLLYAGPLGTAAVVLGGSGKRCVDGRPLAGAIVTGLGKYDGSLSPAMLVDAVRTGVLRYLLQVSDVLGEAQREVPLAALLIGYNSAVNLTVAASVESLVRGVLEGNAKFAAVTRSSIRVSRLDIVELYLDIAISAGYALREACRRLIYIAAPVSTLAFELGFDDPAYFCRFFKRHTGLSPRDYRLRQAAAQGLT